MSRTSFLLSEISKNIGIVIAPPLATTQLKHIEFLDLGDGKILVIFVSTSGLVQRKVIRLKDHYQQAELDRAGRFLVERFSDRTLTEIRNELLRMMEAERIDLRSDAEAALHVERNSGRRRPSRRASTFRER